MLCQWLPSRNTRDERRDERMAAVHECFHQEDALSARGFDHSLGARGVQRHRLFAENVLAGLDASYGLGLVGGMRARDVDRLDGLVGEHCSIEDDNAGSDHARELARFGRGSPANVDHAATARSLQRLTKSDAIPPVPMTPHSNLSFMVDFFISRRY